MLSLFCKQCNKKVEAVPLERPKADFIATCPHCGNMLSPHRLLAPGTMINGFRIEHELGRGGMGIVYLAKQLDLDRDIALKILSDEMASDEAFVKAFFREARGAAALNHPNIVQAIDAGTCGDLHYFVMELIDGENLEIYTAREGALPIHLALKCATSIADALAYAWDCKKLAHRDIKPENIIQKNNTEFKLADLGLVKDCREGSTDHDENLMATPAYAPPEVIRGEKNVPGFKSDMYSFGATLYQIFTGRAPFVSDDPMEICEMQQECQPKPLIGVNPELPIELSMLVDKLMEKDPGKRPDSWNAVLHKLNEITYVWHVTHNSEENFKPSEVILPADTAKQKILMIAAAALAVLFVAEAAFFFLFVNKQKETESVSTKATVATKQVQPQAIPTPAPTPAQQTANSAAPAPAPTPAAQTSPAQTATKAVEEEEEEWEDDPDELKNWRRNYKAILPDSPYERWEMVREYLQDNLYAPKEARQMLKKLEEKEKVQYLKKLQDLRAKSSAENTPLKVAVASALELEKQILAAPLWVAEIFSLDDLNEIKARKNELLAEQKEVKEQEALVKEQQAEIRAAKAEKKAQQQKLARERQKKKQEQVREANRARQKAYAAHQDLREIKGHALYSDDKTFDELVEKFRKKHSSLPDYKKREAALERVIELRNLARFSIVEIIRQNQSIFKGKAIFPALLPRSKFRNADSRNLIFEERKGLTTSLKRLSVAWEEENKKEILQELFNKNRALLGKLDEEWLIKLFAVAQSNWIPVKYHVEEKQWVPKQHVNKLSQQIEEISELLMLYNHYRNKRKKAE